MMIRRLCSFVALVLFCGLLLFALSCSDGNGSDGELGDDVSDDDVHDDDDDSSGGDDEEVDTLVYVGDLPVVRLKGDAYERGYELGRVMGDRIIDLYERYIIEYSLGADPENWELYRLLKEIACSLLILTDEEKQEIQGLADGVRDHWGNIIELPGGGEIELNQNDICIANAIADISQFGCSSVSIWGSLTADGETVIARNLDWDPGPERMLGEGTVVISETPPDESWHFVSIGWPGLFGCYSCVNGDGEAVFIHDTQRYNSGLALPVEPRTLLLRRAILAAEGDGEPFAAFESVIENGKVDTGNNFHFVMPGGGRDADVPAGCFEVDDNAEHPDGFATIRTSMDTDVNQTDLTEALFVTNHHRKRYPPVDCWRYETMIERVNELLDSGDGVIDLEELRWVAAQVSYDWATVYTVVFKPSDWTLIIYRSGWGHPASENEGVKVPYDVLFPW
ncbi:MAG TPA: hypothetical protein ENF73_01950 [Proteobacteria bacterium]|nr:hypothetical protein [Pseudomonadota bacterium]